VIDYSLLGSNSAHNIVEQKVEVSSYPLLFFLVGVYAEMRNFYWKIKKNEIYKSISIHKKVNIEFLFIGSNKDKQISHTIKLIMV
jgi:hypothetical protein